MPKLMIFTIFQCQRTSHATYLQPTHGVLLSPELLA